MDSIDIKLNYCRDQTKLLNEKLDGVQVKIDHLNELFQDKTNEKIDQEWVRVNVGGQLFHTRRSTLMPSKLFSSIFEGLIEPHLDSSGVIYIDREPKNFLAVLDYLRDGAKSLTKHVDLDQLELEADFFQTASLLKDIEIERVRRQSLVRKLMRKYFYERFTRNNCTCACHKRPTLAKYIGDALKYLIYIYFIFYIFIPFIYRLFSINGK